MTFHRTRADDLFPKINMDNNCVHVLLYQNGYYVCFYLKET